MALDSVVSEEVAPDSTMKLSLAMEIVPDSLLESFVPDSIAVSQEMVLDSITPELQELAPDSEMVPDSLPPGAFTCGRCHLVHEDREAWNRAHSVFWPCSRCGLVHMEYELGAMLYGLDEFDCEIFIPDPNNVVMHGNSIEVPAHVIKMLDEKLAAAKDDAKASVR